MSTVKMPVAAVQVHRINLLDPNSEPSDAALKSIMGAVEQSARIKSEQANRALFAQLQRETEAARARFKASIWAPTA